MKQKVKKLYKTLPYSNISREILSNVLINSADGNETNLKKKQKQTKTKTI
jgi:hypothetical protein